MERVARDLPNDLALPLAAGAPWWYWLGGRPSLDLVNTLRERWRRRVETLVGPADLAGWLIEAGLVSGPVRVDARLLTEARDLREAIDACVRAAVEGRSPPRDAVTRIDRWLPEAGPRPALALAPDGLPRLGERAAVRAGAARAALADIALDAARMVGRAEERGRIRICASDTCSARFYDRSPAGRRRWCSMRACGNEAKARRHRARARRAPT
jgi:predicted RNA-binding Zn ribbon-like protein